MSRWVHGPAAHDGLFGRVLDHGENRVSSLRSRAARLFSERFLRSLHLLDGALWPLTFRVALADEEQDQADEG